jgi:alkylation response protein AidB-like acyl-CoA dehydrogenase
MQPRWTTGQRATRSRQGPQEAIRVCGGRAFLKRYPFERYSRDARAAALMRPWTEELATQQAWEAVLGLDGQRSAAAGA